MNSGNLAFVCSDFQTDEDSFFELADALSGNTKKLTDLFKCLTAIK